MQFCIWCVESQIGKYFHDRGLICFKMEANLSGSFTMRQFERLSIQVKMEHANSFLVYLMHKRTDGNEVGEVNH
jgi:hypothetical protein